MDNNVAAREERSSLLAAFARAPEKTETSTSMVTMSPASPIDRPIGAHKLAVYRDEQKVLEKLKVLAAAAGSAWYYRYPVKDRKAGTTDWIEGPTIKLANDLARTYMNCDVDTRVTDLGDSWLIQARFIDLETGFSMTRPFQQRKSQRGMRAESDRALDIALQIGASKAIRNVIVNALQTFADFAFDEARNALVDKIGRNLEGSRARVLERLAAKDIELSRVERVIGRAHKEWTASDIAKVVAIIQSIDDGMTTIDEAFPLPESSPLGTGGAGEGGGAQARTADEAPAAPNVSDSAVTGEPAAAATDDALVKAYGRGQQDKIAGHARKAVPVEYRGGDATRLALCWQAGFDDKPMPTFKSGDEK